MDVANSALINEVRSALKKIYGDRLVKIILYGSYARGEQTPDSDIDLLVVLKDGKVALAKEIHAMHESMYHNGVQNDTFVSVHPITLNRFETGVSFFLERVRKEGKEL